MIYATGRTGSNYLHNAIHNELGFEYAQCPIRPNLLKNLPTAVVKDMLDEKISYLENSENKLVWKTHPNAIVNHRIMNEFNAEMERFVRLPDYVIALTRKNILEATMSRVIARVNDAWVPPYQIKPMSILPSSVQQACNMALNMSLKSFAENYYNYKIDKLLYYEDLNFNSSDIDFLVELGEYKIEREKKIIMERTPPKKSIVINYNQIEDMVMEYFKDIQYDWVHIKDGIIQDIRLNF